MNKNMYRQIGVLAGSQAIFQTASVLVATIGGLAGGQLAPSPDYATLPVATMFLGTAVMTFPASLWMSKVGRKRGFCAGTVAGIVGGISGAMGLITSSFFLLCFGTFLVGVYQAFAQFYRFAASEVATPAFRPKAISLVMAGVLLLRWLALFWPNWEATCQQCLMLVHLPCSLLSRWWAF
ncbi:hypothetical protein [Erwinia sp. E_sp_W01_6]|uniref:hypothetical protein n=1 Tax=unclassified Erwinia TaxID=2622719 RepID=UPI0030D3BA8F